MISIHKRGAKNKLLPDAETLRVATAEMKKMASQPQMVRGLIYQIDNIVVAIKIAQARESS